MATAKVFVRNTVYVLDVFLTISLGVAAGIILLFFMPLFFRAASAHGETAPAVPACFEERPNILPPASCIRIGTSFISQNGKSRTEPIYAIMIGDTKKAEELSLNQAQYFGPWSLDAALYVHPANKPAGTWKKAVYHRPKNVDETKKWLDNKESFYEEAYGDVALIPEPFRGLPKGELAKISSIVAYLDGTTKVYLVDSVTAKSAKALLAAMTPRLPALSPAPAPKADPPLPPKPKIPRGGVDA